ncbi:MAG: single-stranded-DNA-specific exonuclease RecJ [Betaproteobacteria bacterium]
MPAPTDPPRLRRRAISDPARQALEAAGVDPVLARLFAARGVADTRDLDTGLDALLPVSALRNAEAMAGLLAEAIAARQRLLIVGDYDADGATAAAVGLLALRAFGAQVDHLVPNRFEMGYGLTPPLVALAAERRPHIIITVDNGIASLEGVADANRRGMRVLVTDHHLPGAQLPDAQCIVNPNQPGCAFPSKCLAGVGVLFYVLLALRAELRRRGAFAAAPEPNLAALLDLVAVGTVADVVPLDRNNRILVAQGLRRLRAGRARPGLLALLEAAGRAPGTLAAWDLGFVLGPRINAAGRLDDMSRGIACLTAPDLATARPLAQQLDGLNRERRVIEVRMQAEAFARLDEMPLGEHAALVLHDPQWHPGVVGLLASRVKDRCHRPALCFADGPDGLLKGSGRSIRGLHLRDALDLTDRRNPGLLAAFGGHAAAAGASLKPAHLPAFAAAFKATVRELMDPADLERVLETDGTLDPAQLDFPLAEALRDQVWGQAFAPPLFDDEFEVAEQRVVGGGHLRLRLRRDGGPTVGAMLFGQSGPLPSRIRAAYRLEVTEWSGQRSVQLNLDHWQSAGG